MGLAETKDMLTAADKAQAAYMLMTKGSADAIGDMARTSDSYANQVKKLEANIEDLRISMGESLLPIATDIVTQFNEWIKANDTFFKQDLPRYIDGIASAIGRTSKALDSLLDLFTGPIAGDPKELAKQGLEKQLELALRSYKLMVDQGNIDQDILRAAEARIFTLRQRISILEEGIRGRAESPAAPAGPVKLTIGGPGHTPGHPEVESYQQITDDLLGAGALRAEQILEFDMIQAGLLAEQQMEQAQASLETKSQLEIYMTGQLYHDLESMARKHQATIKQGAEKEKEMQMTRLGIYQSTAAGVANTFLQISQAGGKQSKKAFMLYQGFSMVSAGISTAMSIIKTLAEPALPWPSNVAMAGVIGAMGAAQIGMIAAAKPPSYDQGGISTTPGMYYSGVPEAHVPLKSGAIPVNLGGGGGRDTITNIIMDNPVFQDLETQQAVFAQIAEQIAPNAVVRAYDNDHAIRGRIRSRA